MVSRIKITNLNEEEIIKFKDIKYNILEFISNENDINTVHSKLYIDEKILKNLILSVLLIVIYFIILISFIIIWMQKKEKKKKFIILKKNYY